MALVVDSACQCRSHGVDPCVEMIPWRKKWSMVGYCHPGLQSQTRLNNCTHTHTQCREDYCLQIVYFIHIRTLNARQILMLPFERARDFQISVIGSSLPAKLHILWKFHTLEKGTTFNLQIISFSGVTGI